VTIKNFGWAGNGAYQSARRKLLLGIVGTASGTSPQHAIHSGCCQTTHAAQTRATKVQQDPKQREA